jgi:putative transposase
MARIARIVVPGYPHHITQRGNRSQETFFCDDDYKQYIDLMVEWCGRCGVDIWAYCLMPNHTHLIAVPRTEEGIRKAIGEAHRRYARMINFREGWRGYLWQGRFHSFAMDEQYLLAAVRYIELNPVRARLVTDPIVYPWSSARAHIEKRDDALVRVSPLVELIPDWDEFLKGELQEKAYQELRQHERTGRPLGSNSFIDKLEALLEKQLRKKKTGPKGPWKNRGHK